MARKRISQVLFVFSIVLSLTLASCGGGGLSFFATETPTPTQTFTPTATFPPSPTATATQTPTPTPLPTGVESQEQADGSVVFVDYDNKYQLTLLSTWVAIPVTKGDLNDAINELASAKPELAEAAEQFKDLDANVIRLVALNGNPDYIKGGGAPNMIITAFPDAVMATMPLSFVTGAMEEGLTQQGFTIITEGVNTIENTNGVEVQYIDLEQTVEGTVITQRILFFQTKEKLIMVTFTTQTEFSEAIFAEAELIGATIELLK